MPQPIFRYEQNTPGIYHVVDRRSPRRRDNRDNALPQPSVAVCYDARAAQIIVDALNAAAGSYSTDTL